VFGEISSGKTEFIEQVNLYVLQRRNYFEKTLWINLKTCTTPVSVWYAFKKEFEGATTQEQIISFLKDLQMIIVFDNCDHFFSYDSCNVKAFFKLVKTIKEKTHFLKMIMITRENRKE